MRVKNFKIDLDEDMVEKLYLGCMEEQALSVIQAIRSTMRDLAVVEKVYKWEDLFNQVETYIALEELMKYNSYEHTVATFFPTEELLVQPCPEWDIEDEKPKKKRRKKK